MLRARCARASTASIRFQPAVERSSDRVSARLGISLRGSGGSGRCRVRAISPVVRTTSKGPANGRVVLSRSLDRGNRASNRPPDAQQAGNQHPCEPGQTLPRVVSSVAARIDRLHRDQPDDDRHVCEEHRRPLPPAEDEGDGEADEDERVPLRIQRLPRREA